MKLYDVLERGAPKVWAAGAVVLLVCVGAADALTGPDITFSLFYAIPVAMAAWGCGRGSAAAFAALSAVTWQAVDFGKGRFSPLLMVYAWHFSSRTLFLLALTALLGSLRRALVRERESARCGRGACPIAGLALTSGGL